MHYELAPRGQTINKEYYVEVLKRLRDAVRKKRPCFCSSGDWLLHHDNAPVHSSNLLQQFLAKNNIVQLRQPPYSPDIAPCDFSMLPKLKMALRGKRFDDITMYPLPCISQGYLRMVAGQMNSHQRDLGDVAKTRFHGNYRFPLHFRSGNERCEI